MKRIHAYSFREVTCGITGANAPLSRSLTQTNQPTMYNSKQIIKTNPFPAAKQLLPSKSVRACLSGALLVMGAAAGAHAQSSAAGGAMEKMERENQDLRKRLETLEGVVKKEGLLPSGDKSSQSIKALSESTLSGFVTTSFFYDTSKPPGGVSPGYLWSRHTDSFSLNKVKLTLASPPVERSGDKWDAGYRVSLIFGDDAPSVNTKASSVGFESLREAYVEMNVPIGTGLNVKVGELISLLNYESGDGGAVNDNFSQGYQWFYTGNPPGAGVQLGYTMTDWLDVKVRVQNGLYAGPLDNNEAKTVMGAIGIKPNDKIWFSLIGVTGRENAFYRNINVASLLAGWNVTDKLHLGTELDHFWFETPAGTSPVWSTGGWFSYSFTPKFGAAIRAEFLSDTDGVDASGDPLGFPVNGGQDISSVAFTLNIKPTLSIKIQPEVRFDHTSLKEGFGKHSDRVVVGVGASYLF